jgi:hypothetical protein
MRSGPARARPIVRDREQVRGLERIPDLSALDVTAAPILGQTFSSKATRNLVPVGRQFGAVQTDRV